MIIVIFFLVVAFFVAYIISAFFEKASQKETASASIEKEDLRYRKEEVLSAINDLEYDFKMKKMTEADYLQIKSRLSAQAVEIMKKLDELEGKSLENAVSSRGPRNKIRS
jgi:hypothetical protein